MQLFCVQNGTRRRTPGGVFIYTLKKDEHVPMDKTRQIFMEEKKMQHAEKKIKEKQRKQQLKKKISKILLYFFFCLRRL